MVARLHMMALASRMTDHRHDHGTDTPEYANMVTSMCDLRTAVNIARGVPLDRITGQGYPDLAYTRARRGVGD